MRRAAKPALLTAAALTAAALLTAAPAAAEQVRLPLGAFGSAQQPTFETASALAVDQSSGDLYVASVGQNDEQAVLFTGFAAEDTFTLANLPAACSASATDPIAYSSEPTPSGTLSKMESRIIAALEAKCGASIAISVNRSSNNETVLTFREGSFKETSQPLLACAPQSGAGSCEVERFVAGGAPRLERFHPDGTPAPFSALGENVIDGKAGADQTPVPLQIDPSTRSIPSQIAIDESGATADGDLYLADSNGRVWVFAPTGAYLGQITAAGFLGFYYPCGLAVDQSSGDLWIADLAPSRVYRFVPSANPPLNKDYKTPSLNLQGSGPCNLASGTGPSAGSLFVASSEGEYAGVTKWDVSNPAAPVERYTVHPDGVFQALLSLDPASGDLFVGSDEGPNTNDKVTEYDASGASEATKVSIAKPNTGVRGLAVRGSTDRLYVSRNHREVGRDRFVPRPIDVYGSPVTVPDVTTDPVSAPTAFSATFHGTLNPDGLPLTECLFEYLSFAHYYANKNAREAEFTGAATAPCQSPAAAEVPADSAAHPVHADLSGLDPDTHYIYRLAAANANDTGEPNFAENGVVPPGGGLREKGIVFTTASANAKALTEAATSLTPTHATAHGTAFPGGGPLADCFFEYGPTESYGQSAPCSPAAAAIPPDTAAHPVSAALAHLAPEATYHYRLVIENGGGPIPGTDQTLATPGSAITKAASEISAEAATLNGTINPDGVALTQCLFEYGPTTAYGSSAPCQAPTAAEVGAGTAPVAVHARPQGLQLGTTYHFRLAATNADANSSHGADLTFKTLGPPAIAAQWAADVVFSEATLKAQIVPEGPPATYRIEYGTSPAYGELTAPAPVGEGTEAHTVSHFLEALAPATTYHYRFLAENELGATEGPDLTFTTYAHPVPGAACPNQALREENASAALPDCRAYELVSPIDKNGGDVRPAFDITGPNGGDSEVIQSSLDGEKFAFASLSAFAEPQGGEYAQQYIARRGASGWATENISPPTTIGRFEGLGEAPIYFSYQALSPDLSSGWVINQSAAGLGATGQPGTNLYRRDNATGAYEALTTTAATFFEKPRFVGASEDLSHQVLQTDAALTPDAPGGVGTNTGAKIYDFSAGALHLVTVLPDGAPDTHAINLFNSIGVSADGSRGVSADGSRVFWISGNTLGTIYMRENPAQPESAALHGRAHGRGNLAAGSAQVTNVSTEGGAFAVGQEISAGGIPTATTVTAVDGPAHTLTLSAPATQSANDAALQASSECTEADKACTLRASPADGHAYRLLAASRDGSRLLLVDQSGALAIVDPESGTLTPIAGQVPFTEGAALPGYLGAAADLSSVYFVSEEALAPGAGPGDYNLYAWQEGDLAFIGALSAFDVGRAGFNGHERGNSWRPAGIAGDRSVSPDGAHLLFVSSSPALALAAAGYDNAAAQGGEAAREVYAYDAEADALHCISCNPSGARPLADLSLRLVQQAEYGSGSLAPPAALIPPSNTVRSISGDGARAFFEAYDALAPADTNGTWDVYQWQRPGSGTCTEAAPSYSARDGGCVDLISTGQSAAPSELFDAGTDGENVFFRTAQGIDPRDPAAYDAYDARAGGGFPLPDRLTECEGDACQSVPAAPSFPTPASSLFHGAGNLREAGAKRKRCKKPKLRRHGRCANRKPRHHRKQHKRHHKRTRADRRAQR